MRILFTIFVIVIAVTVAWFNQEPLGRDKRETFLSIQKFSARTVRRVFIFLAIGAAVMLFLEVLGNLMR